MQTEKEYGGSEIHERIDEAQSLGQSHLLKERERAEPFTKHNLKLRSEWAAGEEGIDWWKHRSGKEDPRLPDVAKVKRDLKKEIKELKVTHPALGAQYEEELLRNNEFETPPCSEAELKAAVKIYPGSKAGPLPADDPKHYSEWFWRNQKHVKDLVYGKEN